MALKKTFTEVNGVRTTYHRISRVTIDFDNKQYIVVDVKSYVSESKRQLEKDGRANDSSGNLDISQPRSLKTNPYRLDYEELAGSPTRSDIYDVLKTLPEFEGAEDV